MKASEFQKEVHKLAYTAEVNQLYHQIKQRRMWLWDKCVKIGVNVVPVGKWMTEFAEMFRSWSDLLLDEQALELKASELEVPADLMERLAEMLSRQCQLNALEPAPEEEMLFRCQGDINERMYGKGIRTYEQAMAAWRQAAEVNHA
jgi:hypothetical protein